ncbi:MAG: hypothetical protein UU23_C0005G0014 [Candidatus Curtissbacteria bacterium GW2011_GWA1_40_9]|uniref:Uncharacterized protein n=1 Tax=Candidatus Curtissbacteria bacterium GW2011_GWA1_40_9 TaxID=1618408 RepID=A0A0G0TT04_9BACT|nr:MAG: hypothetical protein UU23_C0005G0014 [Candidatus Curtissbacteria bacterium GW2011_GWA1_40_9]
MLERRRKSSLIEQIAASKGQLILVHTCSIIPRHDLPSVTPKGDTPVEQIHMYCLSQINGPKSDQIKNSNLAEVSVSGYVQITNGGEPHLIADDTLPVPKSAVYVAIGNEAVQTWASSSKLYRLYFEKLVRSLPKLIDYPLNIC